MAELQALLDRVKAATGPDSLLDLELHWWFDCSHGAHPASFRVVEGGPQVNRGMGETPDWRWWDERNPPLYTSSIDDAVALVERKLPGWNWSVDRQADEYLGTIYPSGENSESAGEQYGASAPLALLAALLTALQSL